MKRKTSLFIGALLLALALSAGSFAYTFDVASTPLEAAAAAYHES